MVSSRLIPRASENEDEEDAMGGYGLQTIIPATSGGGVLPSDKKAPQSETELAEEKPSWRPMATPPPGLLLRGTFSFPFAAGVWGWHLMLLLLAIAAVGSALMAVYFSTFPSDDIFSADKWFASALLSSLTLLLGLFFLFLLSAVCLTIFHDTSAGVEKFNNRQLGWFTDWFVDASYLVANLFYGAAPAMILIFVLPIKPEIRLPIYLFCEILLFPVFLMSASERKSPIMIYSKPVWKSLWYAWHSWVLFYLLTLLIGETFVYSLRVIPFGNMQMEFIFISVISPLLIIVYFRLLGRLGWFCSGQFDEDISVWGSEYRTSRED
ncbi:MAG: hypothetical protein ABSG67_20940 [Thermoguttaceae bacterium]